MPAAAASLLRPLLLIRSAQPAAGGQPPHYGVPAARADHTEETTIIDHFLGLFLSVFLKALRPSPRPRQKIPC